MQYADGTVTGESYTVNEYMARRTAFLSQARAGATPREILEAKRFGDKFFDEYATIYTYVVELDNGQTVNILQSNIDADMNDRVRIESRTGDFSKGNRRYYNLNRGPPPMQPLKQYLNGVYKGGDGHDYKIVYRVKEGNKQGKYAWEKLCNSH